MPGLEVKHVPKPDCSPSRIASRCHRPRWWIVLPVLVFLTALPAASPPSLNAQGDADECEVTSDQGCPLELGQEVSAAITDATVQHIWRLDVDDAQAFRIKLSEGPYRLYAYTPSRDLVGPAPDGLGDRVLDISDPELGEYIVIVDSPTYQTSDVPYRLSAMVTSGRAWHSAIWEPRSRAMMVFGGYDGTRVKNDARVYRVASNSWSELPSMPRPRSGHAAAWDDSDGQALVVGGQIETQLLGYVWSFHALEGRWIDLFPSGGMPLRPTYTVVWDSADSEALIFGGGITESGPRTDLWAYQPGPNATVELRPAGGPPARSRHSAIWDSNDSQMLIFGGTDLMSGAALSDLWAYRPATNAWIDLTAPGGPSPRASHSAVWDPVRAQMIVFGGTGDDGEPLDDLWGYRPSAGGWFRIDAANGPSARAGHVAVWDREFDDEFSQMLVYGGEDERGFENDLWAYRPQTNTWARLASP